MAVLLERRRWTGNEPRFSYPCFRANTVLALTVAQSIGWTTKYSHWLGVPFFTVFNRLWRTPQLAGAPDLGRFLDRQAAFISQKCTVEYCRARSGLNWDKLFKEAAFVEAMEVCRWESYAAILVEVAVMVEAKLRPSLTPIDAPPIKLARGLVALIGEVLAGYPAPAHRPDGWSEVIEQARTRLAEAQLAAPKPANQLGFKAGSSVYAVLPIHPTLRNHDFELIRNNIRFNLIRGAEDFDRQADRQAIVADIVGAAGAG